MISLIWISNGLRKPSISLKEGKNFFGRETTADFTIDDQRISSIHLCVYQEANDLYIRDINSSNGTYLNGTKVSNDKIPVYNGDRIRLGEQMLIIEGATTKPANLVQDEPSNKKAPIEEKPKNKIVITEKKDGEKPPHISKKTKSTKPQVKLAEKSIISRAQDKHQPKILHMRKPHDFKMINLITRGREVLKGRFASIAFHIVFIALFISLYQMDSPEEKEVELIVSIAPEVDEVELEELPAAASEDDQDNSASNSEVQYDGPQLDLKDVEVNESVETQNIFAAIGDLNFEGVGTGDNKGAGYDSEILGRVLRAGGRGRNVDIRVSLSWDTTDDADLHIQEPGEDGFVLDYFSKRANEPKSPTGGVLDVDANDNSQTGRLLHPVENAYWPKGRAPRGQFTVYVSMNRFHRQSDKPVPFKVEVEISGRVFAFKGTFAPKLEGTLRGRVDVCTFYFPFDYDIQSNLEELETHDSRKRNKKAQRELDGLILE